MSFNRDRFPDGSAVDFDLPPHLLESAARLPSVFTQEMVDALYNMFGGADYFMGREDMRIFTGVDGKPIEKDVVNGYVVEPGHERFALRTSDGLRRRRSGSRSFRTN